MTGQSGFCKRRPGRSAEFKFSSSFGDGDVDDLGPGTKKWDVVILVVLCSQYLL